METMKERIHLQSNGRSSSKQGRGGGGLHPQSEKLFSSLENEKNRGEWKKGKALRLIQGKGGIVRGVILLHEGHTIERPLQLVFPLETRGVDHSFTCRREGETKCSRGTRECGDLQLNRQLKGLQCRCEKKRRTKTDLFTSCMIFC